MGMSQGTYTFLTCFAAFWLIWGLIVLLCCLCSFVRRRVKRRREERLREQTMRTVEMEPLEYEEYVSSPRIPVHHRMRSEPPPAPPIVQTRPWSSRTETDLSKPPCYEEAVLMAEPPPPYSEVLTDTRGIYRKIGTSFPASDKDVKPEHLQSHNKSLFSDRGIPTATPFSGPLASGPPCLELGRSSLILQAAGSGRMLPSWTDPQLSSRGVYGGCRIPLPMPLLGRTTAV